MANHLVDRIATLEETIEDAKRSLSVGRNQRVRVVEIPARPFIKLPGFLPGVRAALGLPGLGSVADSGAPARLLETSVVQQIIDRPGRPLLLTPGSILPLEEEPIR